MPIDSNARLSPSPQALRALPALVGFTAVIGQIVLMREALVLFHGNELSLGIVLAAWLLWTAIGSGLTGLLVRARPAPRRIAAVIFSLWGISLPATVWAMRLARIRLQTVPGELLGPVPILLACFACLSVFCLLSGAAFACTAQLLRHASPATARFAASTAYLLESAGSGLGGLLASLLLLRFLGSFQIACLLLVLNLFAALCLLIRMRRARLLAIALAAATLAFALVAYLAPELETRSQQRLWSGFRVLTARDSIYSRLTLLQTGPMRSLYADGSLLANIPDPATAEEAVHYALLEHPAPRRVLLLGGAETGAIDEALKHPSIQRLDYVELDPAQIALFRQFFPARAARTFSDPRVHVHYADGRFFLRTTRDTFDVVILHVADPANAQWNRFFTVEFFRAVRARLAPGGLLALQLRSSENYISPPLAQFLRCIHHTLHQVFPHIAVLPGDTLHLFAAAQPGIVTQSPDLLISRLRARHLSTLYVREYFLPFRMMPDRMAQIGAVLAPQPQTPVNRDFSPVAYYFSAVLWSAQFPSAYAQLLLRAESLRFSTLLAATAAFSLVLWLVLAPRRRNRARATALWSVTAGGFTLMVLQLLLLLAFQSLFGYLYHALALLVGMFLAGIALGSWFGIRCIRSIAPARLLHMVAVNQLILAAAAPMLLVLAAALAHLSAAAWFAQIAFPLLALACAMPGGVQFSLAAELHSRDRTTQTSAATLYALDLLGGCIGALLLAGLLIPIFGFWPVAWLSALVSAAPAFLAAFAGLHVALATWPSRARRTPPP